MLLNPTTPLQPCDLFFTRNGGLLSSAIRFASWGWGQPYPRCSHTGGFYAGCNVYYGMACEALNTVQAHKFYESYRGTRTEVAIYRPTNLTLEQKSIILQSVLSQVGESYGYTRLALHALDGLLLGANVFRRLAKDDKPICSWLWAHAFRAAGLDFGCPDYVAQPDDMLDFCVNNPEKYRSVTLGFQEV